MSTEQAEVKQMTQEALDALLSLGGAEEVQETAATGQTTPATTTPAKSSTENVTKKEGQAATPASAIPASTKEEVSDILDIPEFGVEDEDEDHAPPAGSATATKSERNSVKAIQLLVNDGTLFEFEGDKKLPEYSEKELAELIVANMEKRDGVAVASFVETLPQVLQDAVQYVSTGGQETDNFFGLLAKVEAVAKFSTETDKDRENVVRAYMSEVQKMTSEEIDSEIQDIKDMNKLADKATFYLPKIQASREAAKNAALEEQTRKAKLKEAQMAKVQEQVYNTVAKKELGGVKIDANAQGLIFNGLMLSIEQLGQIVSQLGIKTNLEHLAQVMWHLRDPKTFLEKQIELGKNAQTEVVHRTLKTGEGQARNTQSVTTETTHVASRTKAPKIPKKPFNIFSKT